MIKIYKRNIITAIILSIVTLGIYGIYWMYLLVKNTRALKNNYESSIGEILCLLFVPFYSLYWWYTRGEEVRMRFEKLNHNATGNGIIYLIACFMGLSIVSAAIMQKDFNSLSSRVCGEI